jgi:hypothetical protein
MRWMGHVAHMGEERRPKIKIPFRKCRWEGGIRMDLREIGWVGVRAVSFG